MLTCRSICRATVSQTRDFGFKRLTRTRAVGQPGSLYSLSTFQAVKPTAGDLRTIYNSSYDAGGVAPPSLLHMHMSDTVWQTSTSNNVSNNESRATWHLDLVMSDGINADMIDLDVLDANSRSSRDLDLKFIQVTFHEISAIGIITVHADRQLHIKKYLSVCRRPSATRRRRQELNLMRFQKWDA